MLTPWLEPIWARLSQQRQQGRLAHGLLLCGPAGVGKRMLAKELVASLLCLSPSDDLEACGQCERCALVAAGSHPDLRQLLPEEDSKVLKVDQVRELTAFLSLTSQFSGWKIALIDPADWMNENAANALLKTLEEPGEGTLLLLISDRPASLSATIRSRCQRIDFRTPSSDESFTWLTQFTDEKAASLLLQRAAGAPIHARALIEQGDDEARSRCHGQWLEVMSGRLDPVSVASEWLKVGAPMCLEWMHGWLEDQIRLGAVSGEGGAARLLNPDLATNRIDQLPAAHGLFERLDQLAEARRLARTPVNQQLLLERVLFDWYRLTAPKRGR
ncbi:MAG: DNA polymerase III subunit delta' [Gammaproteobacteria bacterium]